MFLEAVISGTTNSTTNYLQDIGKVLIVCVEDKLSR